MVERGKQGGGTARFAEGGRPASGRKARGDGKGLGGPRTSPAWGPGGQRVTGQKGRVLGAEAEHVRQCLSKFPELSPLPRPARLVCTPGLHTWLPPPPPPVGLRGATCESAVCTGLNVFL